MQLSERVRKEFTNFLETRLPVPELLEDYFQVYSGDVSAYSFESCDSIFRALLLPRPTNPSGTIDLIFDERASRLNRDAIRVICTIASGNNELLLVNPSRGAEKEMVERIICDFMRAIIMNRKSLPDSDFEADK